MKTRCAWVGIDPLNIHYHDQEWGLPEHASRRLFEFLILEGAQAGLSWLTILKKRENYRLLFDQFDAAAIAAYDEKKIGQLLQNPGVIRNRLKIESTIGNARAYLRIEEKYGSFSHYIWSFVDGNPLVNRWKNITEIPARTAVSDRMSRELKKQNFKFVGSTICYAFMQAIGMVNDHTIDCFRYREVIL